MRNISRLGMVILAIALSLAGPGVQAQKSDPDAAIHQVVQSYVAARERASAVEIAALFTADADQLTSSGQWRRGRDALVRGTLASSKANAGARAITIKTVRLPAPDVAIADGEYVIAASQSGATRQMWTSFVLIRADGRWRISAIRNMLPAPQAP